MNTTTRPIWLEGLNEAQIAAVTSEQPYALVLAGAGSGKTRVLISRLLYLFMHKGCGPAQVLALTFTNKAAGEMRTRLTTAFPWSSSVWMGTFHGIAHRLLRLHYEQAGLPSAFTVIDSDDQQRLCKRILREHEVDEKTLSSKTLATLISREKEAGHRSADVAAMYGYLPWLTYYEAYETHCRNSGLVDFSELLLRSYELLANNIDLLNRYQGRFRHILVDEFQDTNKLQYQWIKLLAGDACNIFIVGDDDQSIYGWRGAEVANIQDFAQTMLPCDILRLEQNYRSTQTILTAANAVISHNTGRMGKNLWSGAAQGEPLSHYNAVNEFDEARHLVMQLHQWKAQGYPLKQAAILYRSNHQSRILEQVLSREGIAYKITGGMRFFDRAEIKDALAYARLLLNEHDDAAFSRIINVPTRGMGDKAIEKIQNYANTHQLSLLQSLRQLVEHKYITGKALLNATQFLTLFETWHTLREGTLDQLIQRIIHDSGLWEFHGKDGLMGEGRQENLEELINAGAQYRVLDHNEQDMSDDDPLLLFLAQSALDAGDIQEDAVDQIQLMTIHAAKGLEFDWVAITGLEESIFPLSRSIDDPSALEEERRLMYVAMTRARQHLFLTSCAMRRFHGKEEFMKTSRFLDEIPTPTIKKWGAKHQTTTPTLAYKASKPSQSFSNTNSAHPFPKGTKVYHARFGEGLVLAVDGMDDDARVQVRFCDATRWLLLRVAKLEHWEGSY